MLLFLLLQARNTTLYKTQDQNKRAQHQANEFPLPKKIIRERPVRKLMYIYLFQSGAEFGIPTKEELWTVLGDV